EIDPQFPVVRGVEIKAVGGADAKVKFQIKTNFNLDVAIHGESERRQTDVEVDGMGAGVNDGESLLEANHEVDRGAGAIDLDIIRRIDRRAVGFDDDVEAVFAEGFEDRLLD